jgi:hypothetical protein
MKFKPFLFKNKSSSSFTLIHMDPVKIKTVAPMYDSLNMVATTNNSPIKKIHLKNNQVIYD